MNWSSQFMLKLFCMDWLPEEILISLLQKMDIRIEETQVSIFTHTWKISISHRMACFYLIASGRCNLRLDGADQAFTLNVGDMAIILPHRGHCLESNGNGLPSIAGKKEAQHTTLIRGIFGWEETQYVPPLHDKPLILSFEDKDNQMLSWMAKSLEHLIHGSVSDQPGAQAIANDLASILFAQKVGASTYGHCYKHKLMPTHVRNRAIRCSLYEMHNRMEMPHTLSLLAKECGMSRSLFAGEFKRNTGVSPISYLQQIRIRRACRLLSKERLTIKEVSRHVGYRSLPAFSRAFKKQTGIAPEVYQMRH